MTLGSPKASSPAMAAFPRRLSSIVVSVGGLAVFLVLASWLLISNPIGSSVASSKKLDFPIPLVNYSNKDPRINAEIVDRSSPSGSRLEFPENSTTPDVVENGEVVKKNSTPSNLHVPMNSGGSSVISDAEEKSDQMLTQEEKTKSVFASSNITEEVESAKSSISSLETKSGITDAGSGDTAGNSSSNDLKSTDVTQSGVQSDCDLYHGNWFYDPLGPLYTNNTCPVITQMQNCQGNGRPDKEYENWRWKPFQCDLPRFDGKKFLELMRGKTLAFVGDSVARNQMESMLCLLWQVEVPKNRGNRKMQRWYFRSASVMIVRIWSSWLVHQTSEAFDFAPKGVVKLHLDVPDEGVMEAIPNFDVVVLSSGHWFAKQSVYMLNNEIVGGQLWWPDKSRPMKVNNVEAFGISVESILTALVTHPNYTGLTILRSFSPDHYEGGAWNTGGSCTGKVKPLALGEIVENGFTQIMHQKQVTGFNQAIKQATGKSKLRLMDITEAFGYRHDGHPGPYRNPDPNKITKRGPDGRPPPQDCLHWCMPGPVDTWNELVLEIIRREYEGNKTFSS
ncbi:protein YLS7 [Carica papaya]|uniref:protein YLS7 n=1 Tax=Carica papaya TaxID=3649 RepID=UPI000B8C97DD|nr:protein YLS7 [Carica papaya]